MHSESPLLICLITAQASLSHIPIVPVIGIEVYGRLHGVKWVIMSQTREVLAVGQLFTYFEQ